MLPESYPQVADSTDFQARYRHYNMRRGQRFYLGQAVSAEVSEVEDIWAGDLLGRRSDAEFLKQFLIRRIDERSEEGRKKSYVLNLDAGWGHGKTFFLTRFKQELEAEGYLAVYVNAWEDDHAEDPMIAVMAAVDEVLAPRLKKKGALKKSWDVVKQSGLEIATTAGIFGTKKLLSKLIGEGVGAVEEIIERQGDEEGEAARAKDNNSPREKEKRDESGIAKGFSEVVEKFVDRQGEEALKGFRKGRSSISSFKSNLAKFLSGAAEDKEFKIPLFVLVDELDRCRPTYAISLLERVKHLFEVNNVVFVVATDSSQLRHAIKAVYGESFESGRYLLRFFDRSYHFEEPSLEAFARSLFGRFGSVSDRLSSPFNDKHEEFFSSVIRYFGLSLRDAEQCFDYLRTVATIWPYKVKIELLFLLPLIVAYQQGDDDLRSSLEGFSRSSLQNYLGRFITKDWAYKYTYRDDNFQTQKVTTSFSEILIEMASMAEEPLNVTVRNYHSYSHTRWLGEVFENEFRVLHRGSHNPDSPPMSLLRKYPEMVRSAGRLMTSTGSPNE